MSENNSIKAHGGVLINRITKVDSAGLFSITISEDLANDVENIADGIFSPLEGFLGQQDFESVDNRKLCCEIRKVHPMNKMLNTLDGWITGLRRDQTKNREDVKIFQLDHGHGGILKINPIIDWTWEQIQEYIKKNNLPYNSLLDKGFPSIGCEPCTRAIKPGEDIRAGRWWWEQDGNKECGLHIDHK